MYSSGSVCSVSAILKMDYLLSDALDLSICQIFFIYLYLYYLNFLADFIEKYDNLSADALAAVMFYDCLKQEKM